MKKKILIILGVLLGLIILAGIFGESSTETDFASTTEGNQAEASGECASPDFEQAGYMKSDNNMRVFTFSYPEGTCVDDIEAHASGRAYTEGRQTWAYYYLEGGNIPADGVTFADNVGPANDVIRNTPGLSKWGYVYVKALTGDEMFVDCTENPDDTLCQQGKTTNQ